MKRKVSPYIINAKSHSFIRFRDAILTVLLWLLFLYMIRDFYAFALDFYDWMLDGDSTIKAYPKLRIIQTLLNYGMFMGMLAIAYVMWAQYNRLRFKGKRRRKNSPIVRSEDTAEFFRLPEAQVVACLQARQMTVHQDDNGRVTSVTFGDKQ